MRIKKLLFVFGLFTLLVSGIPKDAAAQWSIGASYEIRNQDPENGFGLRLEREILSKVPVINLGLRAHFSYFNEDNYADKSGSFNYSADITSYDYGIAATAGVSLGLVEPYIGTGVGAKTLDVDFASASSSSDSNIFWNGFVGAEISPIPFLKPFVEYRFEATDNFKSLKQSANFSDIRDGNTGRLIFGLSLNF